MRGATAIKTRLVTVEGLHKSYASAGGARLDVLREVSLRIQEKTVVSIIGPSGCGKSTLLRCIAGVEQGTRGGVSYHYGDGVMPPPIPMVLQVAALLPWRTVHGNISLGLELVGQERQWDRVDEYVAMLGLEGFSKTLPKDLSGGMQARVSIGRALIAASRLVLFDEAFTELDEVTRQTINDMFCDHVEQRALAAVVVSHDIAEAVYLADEVVVLSRRPSMVAHVIPIDLPRPRLSDMRSGQSFINVTTTIRELVRNLW